MLSLVIPFVLFVHYTFLPLAYRSCHTQLKSSNHSTLRLIARESESLLFFARRRKSVQSHFVLWRQGKRSRVVVSSLKCEQVKQIGKFSLFSSFQPLLSTRMSKAPPIVQAHNLSLPPRVARITRSTSQLQKEVIPTSEDQEMDEIVLAPLPSGTSTTQSQDQLLSSQRREQPVGDDGKDAKDLDRVSREKETVVALDDSSSKPNPLVVPLTSDEMEYAEDQEMDEDAEAAHYRPESEEEEEEEEEEDCNSDVSEQSNPRSEGEVRQIVNEMEQLEQNVPQIVEKYRLVDRLGEGEL